MATDGVNIAEDAEMAECDGDKVVTMMDVLQEQQDFEEDANAVLGASDDKNCTYSKGYIKRQALYACLTCCTEAKVDPTKRAGVCLACSLTCHENHELIELYTKRNFRCDCGNQKFNSHPCQFTMDKTDLNDENIYNQNFSGLYCTCQRPYPDPESTIEDDMIQCIICEDWLHASHLEAVVPANDQYSEMICKNCMEKNEFLHDYSMFAVTAEAGDVDIATVGGDAKSAENSLCNGDSEKEKLVNGTKENKTVNGDVELDDDKVTVSTDSKTDDESVVTETNEKTKQDEISTIESDENEKPDTDDNKMDLDAESKIEQEQSEPVKIDAPAEPEDLNYEKELKETTDDTEKSNNKSDATENKPISDPVQDNVTSPEKTESIKENPDSTDDKMESTNNEPEKADETIKEQTETQEQSIEQSTSREDCDGDNVQENKTDISERTEQQLLDDLTALTADNPTSEEKMDTATEKKPETTTEHKPVESMEQPEDSKEKDVQTNNEQSAKETTNDNAEKSAEKPVVENIEVPDTSQSEKDAKENSKEKTNLVMDAIDELLQTANEAEEIKEPTSESTESKETVDNVRMKESDDVQMSASENKTDSNVPEMTEDTADKPSTNTDVEMSDTTTQNEPVSKGKVDEPTSDSESKDCNNTEATKVNEDKLGNELVADVDVKSEVTDSMCQENIALNKTNDKLKTLNETDSELKTSYENDSSNKTEPSKDGNDVPTVIENAKEHKRKLSTDLTDDISSKKVKLECVRPKDVKRVHKGATFWPSNFRQKLCTCGECLSMYKDLKVLFLTDMEDTVFAYESLGKENVAGGASQYEKGMQALSSLDRIQQINALTEYNRMRDKLLDFLKSFKDRKEIVKEEDIKAFFAGMKPRREPDGVYFCR